MEENGKAGGKKPTSTDNTIAEILKKFAENPQVINEKMLRCKFFATLDPNIIPTCFKEKFSVGPALFFFQDPGGASGTPTLPSCLSSA